MFDKRKQCNIPMSMAISGTTYGFIMFYMGQYLHVRILEFLNPHVLHDFG